MDRGRGRVNGVALAWMTRANSGLLILVPSTLPLFLLANSTAAVRSNWRPGRHNYQIHTALNPLKFTEKEEEKRQRLLVPFWIANTPVWASLENVAAALQPSHRKHATMGEAQKVSDLICSTGLIKPNVNLWDLFDTKNYSQVSMTPKDIKCFAVFL